MIFENKTIFVTGGTGFIGGRLVERLVLEHRANVRVLIRNFGNAMRVARLPVERIVGDVTDAATFQKAIQGCDVVFHCAHDFALNKKFQEKMTVQGTRNVAEAVLKNRVPRMVHLSSFAVYGHSKKLDGDLFEDTPRLPSKSPYIQAKRQAEQLVLELYRSRGLPVVVLQPTIVYGPFCKSWTLGPIKQLKKYRVPLVNGGGGYCNAVYIDDVVEAMLLAATKPEVSGECFIISGKKPVSFKEFFNAFEEAVGISSTVTMSSDELRRMNRKQARQKWTIFQILSMLKFFRHPKVFSRLERLGPFRAFIRLFKIVFSENQWNSIRAHLILDSSGNNDSCKKVLIPVEEHLALYESKTWARIDKAKKLLDYTPKYNFKQGMELTSAYIQWANLI